MRAIRAPCGASTPRCSRTSRASMCSAAAAGPTRGTSPRPAPPGPRAEPHSSGVGDAAPSPGAEDGAMSAPSARTTGEGWMVFAGVLFLLLGLFNLMWAIAAFAADDDFRVDELLFGDLTLWGIIFLAVGAAQLGAAWLIGTRNSWGRVLGIGLACLSATFAMLTFGARPLWAAT